MVCGACDVLEQIRIDRNNTDRPLMPVLVRKGAEIVEKNFINQLAFNHALHHGVQPIEEQTHLSRQAWHYANCQRRDRA